ncbi:helix-turn-helix domain-containing protein [Nocardia sp. CA2R105]|uniref:helix-turn-helix domain-containing protein n=1 Tax=Nocardia coffeae TaxID=2873381 RepID=UPI001CA5F89B|nr:helix-turn-helix domain-containing protein [Nocardia coffeae]MBY8862059.1 helix-turn-helix domain-containing protein [Nocardia coffeae]
MMDHTDGDTCADDPRRGFTAKLNFLFATIVPAGGREYSNARVAGAICATGVQISPSYIWELRKGRKDNPTLKHLQALADFFGVPPAYFLDAATHDRVTHRLEQLRAEQQRLRELAATNEVQMMALRAGELSSKGRRQVADMLEMVHRLEQAERHGEHGDEG